MKTKLITLCAVCSAAALVCQLGASYLVWAGYAFLLLASVFIAVPSLVSPRYWFWSVLTYVASATLCIVLGGASNAVTVLAGVVFFYPFALVKLFCEGNRQVKNVKIDAETNSLYDFDKKTKSPTTAPRLSGVWRWVAYYAFLEIALALYGGLLYLFSPSLFQNENVVLFCILVAVGANAVLPVYNVMLGGVFKFVRRYAEKYRD